MITSKDLKQVYGIGHRLGIVRQGGDDELHQYIEAMYGKSHVKQLTDAEARALIDYLKNQADNLERETDFITYKQLKYIDALMDDLLRYSASDAPKNKRLSGVIVKALQIEEDKTPPVSRLTKTEGTRVIETLKRYVHSAKKKKGG